MRMIKVFEYASGEPLGRGYLGDEKFAEYEQLEGNPSGAVRLDEWMTEDERQNVTAQDDAVVYFEPVQEAQS